MCGIAGVVSRAPIADADALAAQLDALLAHRGPDGSGQRLLSDGRALLVHRRLSIIDLTSAGAQPMSCGGRHWLVYNGEIYNYQALRSELEQAGETFDSQSDTEVILRLLVREGARALARLRGMFALAWWDDVSRTLLIARDRFGIKPLYFAARSESLAFASEIQALVRSRQVAREIDPAAVLAYLEWGSIPAPLTWVAGVEALEPGTWLQWSFEHGTSRGQFADARALWTSTSDGEDAAALQSHAHEAITDAVRAHLVADVPVGVFLSGGIDSSALVAAARPLVRDLQTYTVSVDDAEYDEGEAAALTAQHFGTTHHALRVDATDVQREFPRVVQHLDSPTNDALNSFFVARAVARTGVKAVLSGLGGDELFGGYPSFRRLPTALRLSSTPALLPAAATMARVFSRPAQASRFRHIASAGGGIPELYRALRGFFMPAEIASLAGDRLRESQDAASRVACVEQRTLAALGPESALASTARLETTMYLRSQLLRDTDAMAMAHALEVRVPFVDHPLIGAIWPALGRHPELLARKRLLAESLPPVVRARLTSQPKRGFTLPFARWMKGSLSPIVRSGLHDLARDGWISANVPDAIWRDFEASRVHWSRPWALGVLGRFLHDA